MRIGCGNREVIGTAYSKGPPGSCCKGPLLLSKIDRKFGLGIQYPTVNEIAEKIARQSEARVVPTGMHALNMLGLSTQVPMNYIFYTDGNSRTVNLFNGRKLRFKRVALRNLAYQNKTLMLAVFALKEIGRPQVTEEHIAQLKTIFAGFRSRTFCPICGWCQLGFIKSLCRFMESNFWTLPEGQKRMLVAQTSERVGLPPQAVEKAGG